MDPWFKFYASDYLLDEEVDILPLEAQGILVRLWCLCWRSAVIPDLPDVLALRAKVDPRVMRKHWKLLRSFFEEAEGGLVSGRMERERSESRAISESRRLGAQKTNQKRWGKRVGDESLNDRSSVAERQLERVAEVSVSESESEVLQTPIGVCGDASAPPVPEPRAGKAKEPKKPKRAKPKDPEDQSLEEILGGKNTLAWERFWKTMQVWNRDKLFAPKKLARAWLKACTKADAKLIYVGALSYRDEFLAERRHGKDETQFMKNPLEWLEEEGWTAQAVEPELEIANA